MTDGTRDRRPTYRARRILLSAALAAAVVALLPMTKRTPAQQHAPMYTVLHDFTGEADGGLPQAGVILDEAGNIYGTASGFENEGVVFKLDPTGNETVLYTFTGGADGGQPFAGLIRDAAGNLYGTTLRGGVGAGVVFKLGPSGNETVLYSFTGGTDGGYPVAGLIRDTAGNFYGTTSAGGNASGVCALGLFSGCGVVFKLDPASHETVLYGFTGGADGAYPVGGLLRDAAGDLYGAANGGGNFSRSCGIFSGCGVVFRLDTLGKETVLYTFSGGTDGASPSAGLIRDRIGNLYGTAAGGGGPFYNGVVFKLQPAERRYRVLYSFSGPDGSTPAGSLIMDAAGNLGGTTYSGGTSIYGVVFQLRQVGKEVVVHRFTGADGASPSAGLVRDRSGNAYGTTTYGGTNGVGVVFKLSPQ